MVAKKKSEAAEKALAEAAEYGEKIETDLEKQRELLVTLNGDLEAAKKDKKTPEAIGELEATIKDQSGIVSRLEEDLEQAKTLFKEAEAAAGKEEPAKADKPADGKPAILSKLVLKQGGKEISGEPKTDNYAVYVKKNVEDVPAWNEILRDLQGAYPRCVFTFLGKQS